MPRMNEFVDYDRMRTVWARRFREAAAALEDAADAMEDAGVGEISLAHTATMRAGLLAAEKFVLDALTTVRRERAQRQSDLASGRHLSHV